MAGRYVALLRGINVGTAKCMAMAELRALVEKLGYSDVRTLLNSGNIVFTAARAEPREAALRIQKALEAKVDRSSTPTARASVTPYCIAALVSRIRSA